MTLWFPFISLSQNPAFVDCFFLSYTFLIFFALMQINRFLAFRDNIDEILFRCPLLLPCLSYLPAYTPLPFLFVHSLFPCFIIGPDFYFSRHRNTTWRRYIFLLHCLICATGSSIWHTLQNFKSLGAILSNVLSFGFSFSYPTFYFQNKHSKKYPTVIHK